MKQDLVPKYLKIKIPEDWEIIDMKNIVNKHNSGIFKNKDLYGSGANIVGVVDLYDHMSVNGQIFGLVELTDDEKRDKTLAKGDLVYAESSLVKDGIGKTLFVTEKGVGTIFAWHTRRFSLKEGYDPEFVNYQLNSDIIRTSIIARSTTTALTGITVKEYFGTKIAIPSTIKEQQKMVPILSNVDNLIISTQNLIDKNIKLKHGLMQKLLTKGIGHKKFKNVSWLFGKEIEIPKEWEVKKINDVFDFLISGTSARSDLNESSEIRYIHYGDIHTKWNLELNCDSEKIPRIDQEKVSKLPLLKEGDLIIADASEDVEGSGVSVLLKNVKNKKIVAGLHTIVLRSKDESISPEFIKYMTSMYSVKIQIISYITGSKVFGLTKKNCRCIKVPFPKFQEQQKIASIFSNVDKQISIHTKYREKLKKLKKSLSQKLLIGEIRVV